MAHRRTAARQQGAGAKDAVSPQDAVAIKAALKRAGLRLSRDASPGYTRRKQGKAFFYVDTRGKRITDKQVIARINSLAIPPAYKDVWICPSAKRHVQATGIDARGRKQYRYHPDWRDAREEGKFSRMAAFGQALPALRRRVRRDLRKGDMSYAHVMAAIVTLLQTTFIRIGNDAYARDNQSYGLTTLRAKNVTLRGDTMTFTFNGKSGQDWNVSIRDGVLAKTVRMCNAAPGHEIFKFVDDTGKRHDVNAQHVNAYIAEVCEGDFTAKDFRTWFGTVLALATLAKEGDVSKASQAEIKRRTLAAVDCVAARLGNTRAVCRKSYIHPAVLENFSNGTLPGILKTCKGARGTGLDRDEKIALAFLKKYKTS